MDKLAAELCVSRRHARNLMARQQNTASAIPEKPASPLAQARLKKTNAEIAVLEEKLLCLRLESRELANELLYREEAMQLSSAAHLAVKNALANMPKNLGPRLVGQSAGSIEKTLAAEADRICRLAKAAVSAFSSPHSL
ncbi:MAG: hypothetical protein WEB60_08295 [Terrimicrobiaceae bacterium]